MNHSHYHNLGEVGQGQFGKVLCGCDLVTGQLFALKRLEHRRLPTHKFLKELAILIRLNHPNIVSFHGVEYKQGGRYIVMDYCQGGTLRQLLESKVELSLLEKLGLVLGTLEGLEHIHQHHIIHCDLKPDNILLDVTAQSWIAKIADFGIARFLEPLAAPNYSGETGSPAYMAPERFYGRFSVETDLYAVGVLLYELVTGHRPFAGMPLDVMKAHLNQPLRIPKSIPTVLKAVIRKALQKLPQHRYHSASEMRLMLETVIASLQHSSPQPVLQTLESTVHPIEPELHVRPINPQGLARTLNIKPQDLKPYLRFDQVVHHLWWRPEGCMVSTRVSEGLALWLKINDTVQSLGIIPISLPDLSQSLRSGVDIDGQGCRVAVLGSDSYAPRVRSTEQPANESQQSIQLQLYRLSPPQLIKSIALAPTAEQIWITSERHVLVAHHAVADPEVSGKFYQQLQLLNRRGQSYWTYSLEGVITAAALPPNHPNQLFAVTTGQESTGFFIHLLPLKIKRIPLNVCAEWICAAHWGYIVGDRLGNIICLNRRGKTVAKAKLPLLGGQTISATTFLEPATLLIALQEQAQSTVMTLNLSLHLPRSLLTL
jgi:serine/threonine protein kinase